MNISNLATLNIKILDYRHIISLIGKEQAINLIQLNRPKKQSIIKHKNLLSHIKLSK